MKKVIIFPPIFNDWESLDKLLKEINFETSGWDAKVAIVIINDSSTQKKLPINYKFENIVLLYYLPVQLQILFSHLLYWYL